MEISVTDMRAAGKTGYVARVDWVQGKLERVFQASKSSSSHGASAKEITFEITTAGVYEIQDANYGGRKTHRWYVALFDGVEVATHDTYWSCEIALRKHEASLLPVITSDPETHAREYFKALGVESGVIARLMWDLSEAAFQDFWKDLFSQVSARHRAFLIQVGTAIVAKQEKEIALEDAVNQEIHARTTHRDDEALDEVDCYAVLYADRIIVTANITGMGARLPKSGRRYIGSQGDMRWQYPVGALEDLKACSVVEFILNEAGEKVK